MGMLVDGEWKDVWYNTKDSGGRFVRTEASFRNWITSDGSAGPSGKPGFKAESGRYHLYISHACPWAHRTMIFRALKGLQDHITVDVVDPDMLTKGWTLHGDFDGATGDSLFGHDCLHKVYTQAKPDMTGRVTVPILWDKKTNQIVSNESSEIIRMFNSAFDGLTGNQADFWPTDLRAEIEDVNERVYNAVNNGVYKCGFATSQEAYDEAAEALFEALDWLEKHLTTNRYLVGNQVTEADWRLFTTLVRFDAVYVTHFKCDRNRIVDFPALWAYARELYQVKGVAETINFDHIRRHYFFSHETINPHRIISTGPAVDWSEPHGRGG
ncbi:MAG: glutathione S-transferase family protein [Pikeienuella sp.]